LLVRALALVLVFIVVLAVFTLLAPAAVPSLPPTNPRRARCFGGSVERLCEGGEDGERPDLRIQAPPHWVNEQGEGLDGKRGEDDLLRRGGAVLLLLVVLVLLVVGNAAGREVDREVVGEENVHVGQRGAAQDQPQSFQGLSLHRKTLLLTVVVVVAGRSVWR